MDALNIGRADIYPRATEEIPKIIEVIQGLVDKGYAYPAQGSVYFRVNSVSDYGKLSHRSLESMMSACSVEMGREKEDPMDFALWKAAKPGEPSWASPWGKGRPGWHIECSAMSLGYLGDTLDIHGGGQDLIFPHHENEIVQSESFTGVKPFVKYWLHNGLVQLGEDKMSKSTGKLITIKEAREKYSPDAIRIFILSSHYRSPLTYSEETLEAAERGAERLARVISRDDPTGGVEEALDAEPYYNQFIDAMDDDFNTPQALAVLFNLASAINQAADSGISFLKARSVLSELARDILGLKLEFKKKDVIIEVPVAEAGAAALAPTVITGHIPSANIELRVKLLVSVRQILRSAGQWPLADKIRATLGELGITIEDGRAGPSTINYRRKFTVQPTQETQLLGELLDEIRAKLAELGIALEDTPKGTVWKQKRG